MTLEAGEYFEVENLIILVLRYKFLCNFHKWIVFVKTVRLTMSADVFKFKIFPSFVFVTTQTDKMEFTRLFSCSTDEALMNIFTNNF